MKQARVSASFSSRCSLSQPRLWLPDMEWHPRAVAGTRTPVRRSRSSVRLARADSARNRVMCHDWCMAEVHQGYAATDARFVPLLYLALRDVALSLSRNKRSESMVPCDPVIDQLLSYNWFAGRERPPGYNTTNAGVSFMRLAARNRRL